MIYEHVIHSVMIDMRLFIFKRIFQPWNNKIKINITSVLVNGKLCIKAITWMITHKIDFKFNKPIDCIRVKNKCLSN